MSTAELKLDLIKLITSITDKTQLEELLQLFKLQTDDSIYITSQEEKEAIAEARKQVKNKETITNTALQKEISEWLEK